MRILNLGMDTQTPTGKLMLTVLGGVAQYAEPAVMRSDAIEVEVWPARWPLGAPHNIQRQVAEAKGLRNSTACSPSKRNLEVVPSMRESDWDGVVTNPSDYQIRCFLDGSLDLSSSLGPADAALN
jgi:hypothetical protein